MIRHWPKILDFLGYDPEPHADGLPARLRAVRRRLGLTQAELAIRLGQDERQINDWEGGRKKPHGLIAGRIEISLRALEGRSPDSEACTLSFFDATRWRRRLAPVLATAKPRTLGERLRAARLRQGMRQEQAARLLGVSRAFIYRWERGLAQVPRGQVASVRRFLEGRVRRRSN